MRWEVHESRHANKMMCFPKLKRTGVNIVNSPVIVLVIRLYSKCLFGLLYTARKHSNKTLLTLLVHYGDSAVRVTLFKVNLLF